MNVCTEKGIEKLKQMIVDITLQQKYFDEKIPTSFLAFEEQLMMEKTQLGPPGNNL